MLTPRATVEAIRAGYRPLVHLPALPDRARGLTRRCPVPGPRAVASHDHRSAPRHQVLATGRAFHRLSKLFTPLRVPHQERFKRRVAYRAAHNWQFFSQMGTVPVAGSGLLSVAGTAVLAGQLGALAPRGS